MKMPEEGIEPDMLAPCGMNCMVCYRHCFSARPCPGCRKGHTGKPGRCRACKIRACAGEKQLSSCADCGEYPCKAVAALDKSYRRRYGVSLAENGRFAKEYGIAVLMAIQKEQYTCAVCGGIISLHDAVCGDCGERAKPGK